MSKRLVMTATLAFMVVGMTGRASAVVINAALGKPATQSTTGWSLGPGLAVDTFLGNVTHTATGDMAPWWEVDLTQDYLIQSIDFYNRVACCGERLYNLTWEIRDELDAVVYTSAPPFNPFDGVGAPTSPGLGPFSIDLSGEPGGGVTGRKVRVDKVGYGGSEYLALAEVKVFADIETNNVALGAPITATGPLYNPASYPVENLVDGWLGSFAHSDADVTTFAYELDLGETIVLDRINVWGRQHECCPERLADYRVSLHEDDGGSIGAEVWSTELVGQGSALGAPDTFVAGDGVGTFAGQWIRVDRIDHREDDYILQIAEIEAFRIPEPSTFALLGIAGLLLPLLWRRMRRA